MLYSEEMHILKFSISFIERAYRDRFEQILTKPRIRKKFIESLPHFQHFINSNMLRIPGSFQELDEIYKALSSVRNIPDEVYIISESAKLDMQFLRLDDGLNEIVSSGHSSIISILPGELAYYEGEGLGERYILSKLP
ncbi:hypothetical protein EHO58_05505 [Leptospira selangorensis]|uniref:hypothetical protein n=1 Tax=Leptospira selangorensis TaxID=2484982 RepID=UPI0010845272|nr:hypothetical protein [Leptospira selangorensis]TGK08631.1 hypothetical protein EHO58_05505 [Leptospira selangorensis]